MDIELHLEGDVSEAMSIFVMRSLYPGPECYKLTNKMQEYELHY